MKSKQEREAWKNSIAYQKTCRPCGRTFPITNGDIDYFNRKGQKPTKSGVLTVGKTNINDEGGRIYMGNEAYYTSEHYNQQRRQAAHQR